MAVERLRDNLHITPAATDTTDTADMTQQTTAAPDTGPSLLALKRHIQPSEFRPQAEPLARPDAI